MRRSLSREFRPPAAVVPVLLRAPGGDVVAATDALIDTGADVCVVSERLAAALDLPPVRLARVAGIFGMRREVISYRVDLEIVGLGAFHVEAFGIPGERTIVGRSVLQHLILRVDGPGETVDLNLPE